MRLSRSKFVVDSEPVYGEWEPMIDKPAARSLPLQILAYLFAGLAILSLPIAVFANQTVRAISSPEVLSEILSQVLFSTGSARDTLINGLLSSDRIETVQPLLFETLNQDELNEIIGILIPDGWIENQLNAAVEELLSWIESDRGQPDFVLDLSPIKQGLQGGGANRMIEIIFDAAPTCTPSQLNELQAALRGHDLPQSGICVPEGDLALELRGLVESEVLLQIRELPSQLTLPNEFGDNQDLLELKNVIVFLLELLRRIRLIPILFFGLLMTIAIRSINELGRWWGIPLILGSILGLSVVLLMAAFGPVIFERTLASSEAPIAVLEVLQSGVWSVVLHILKAAAFQNIVAIIFGALLYGLTRIMTKQPKVEVAQPNAKVEREEFPSPPPVKPFRPDDAQESNDDEIPSGIFD